METNRIAHENTNMNLLIKQIKYNNESNHRISK